MPRVGGNELWKTLSAETKRFARFSVLAGEEREFYVHSGQSVMVRELSEAPAKAAESNSHDELRAEPENAPPGRYLLRGNGHWDKPYEAELLEWSSGGRLKLGSPGTPRWLEDRDIPFVVERLARGIVTAEADETGTGSVERSEIEPGPKDAPKPPMESQ
jgi:hypothetical protein